MCLDKKDRLENCLNHPKPYVYRLSTGWIVFDKGSSAGADLEYSSSWEEAYAIAISFAEKERI